MTFKEWIGNRNLALLSCNDAAEVGWDAALKHAFDSANTIAKCEKCQHYLFHYKKYSEQCYECKQYYADLFVLRK